MKRSGSEMRIIWVYMAAFKGKDVSRCTSVKEDLLVVVWEIVENGKKNLVLMKLEQFLL